MTDTDALRALLAQVEAASKPDQELDAALSVAFDLAPPGGGWLRKHAGCFIQEGAVVRRKYADGSGFSSSWAPARFTSSLDAAVALVERRLPGFWQSSGLCALTGHASIGPDYNGPDADRLRREWPEERFHEGFHADLAPGDGRHRQCLALVHCVLQAEIARV